MFSTHLSTSNVQLNLTTMSTHQGLEFLRHTSKDSQSVILCQGLQEVLDNVAASTANLEQFLDNLLLILRRETGSVEND